MTESPMRPPGKKRKARPAGSASTGLPLDLPVTPAGRPTVVLSSNFTIGPLFSRGALLPEVLDGEPLSTGEEIRLQSFDERVPREAVERLVASARNVVPIAIRLRAGAGLRSVSIRGVVPVPAVCSTDVDAVVFRSDKEKSRFESLEYSNYDLSSSGLRMEIEPSVFEGDAPPAPEQGQGLAVAPASRELSTVEAAVEATELPALLREVRRRECLVGFLAHLLTSSPPRRSWMSGVQHLFGSKPPGKGGSWPERLAGAALSGTAAAATADDALLAAAIDACLERPAEDGWPAQQVLEDIRARATSRLGPEQGAVAADIGRWADRAADVLAARSEPRSLADDDHVVQRAILLLLLRGDLDAIAAGRNAGTGLQRPGWLVSAVAAALAALRTGLRALPSRFKREPAGAGDLLRFLGEAFLEGFQPATAARLVPTTLPQPTITYRGVRTLQGEWITSIGAKECARSAAEFDSGLERLLTMGRHLGLEFEEHGDNGLVTSVRQASGRERRVYLEVLGGVQPESAMVRFSSPFVQLLSIGKRRRVTGELAMDLLRLNGHPLINCRFAVNGDASQIIVIADQMLATLDEAEFRQHMHHVARTAEEYDLPKDVPVVPA
jgi:hypothetical protein